ncbi:MAG: DUF1667 domain-containing protein [Treponema phagedenis]|uniref:DUF1667 domain-containing protein n=1 Tax=Treponema phagedenis TaxID=162 RepID=UPI0031341DFB
MAETKNIICTACPRGCRLVVEIENLDAQGISVSRNKCPKGEAYGKQEAVCPMRMLTTTVASSVKDKPRLSVKTSDVVPLKNFAEYMRRIRSVNVSKACKPGDIIVKDFAGAGIDLLATGGTV